jgi:photosystem II stability/assembly factor-like uncharacterized protein
MPKKIILSIRNIPENMKAPVKDQSPTKNSKHCHAFARALCCALLLCVPGMRAQGPAALQSAVPQSKGEREMAQTEGAESEQREKVAEYHRRIEADEHGNVPSGAFMRAVEHAKGMPFVPAAWANAHKPGSANAISDTSISTAKSLSLAPASAIAPLFESPTNQGFGTGPGPWVAGVESSIWISRGPGNVGGLIWSIAIDPKAQSHIWIGSAGGGIWKTTDSGASWVPTNDFYPHFGPLCLAMLPSNSNTMYVGTEENGVFRSTDAGVTWNHLPEGGDATYGGVFSNIRAMAISPANAQVIVLATHGAIFLSTDGGNSWNQVFTSAGEMYTIAFDPSNASKLIAGGENDVVCSIDGGMTWAQASGFTRPTTTAVAYCRSSPSVVYAYRAYLPAYGSDSEHGMCYKSTDGGHTYVEQASRDAAYPNATVLAMDGGPGSIWVDPTRTDTVVIGSGNGSLWRTTDGGSTLTRISASLDAPAVDPHTDQRFIFGGPGFNGTTNRKVYFANDGGLYRANDVYNVGIGSGWQKLDHNLRITQFHNAAGSPVTGLLIGGTQDNGTQFYTPAQGAEAWHKLYGADGLTAAVDPLNDSHIYFSYYGLHLARSLDRGASVQELWYSLPDVPIQNSPSWGDRPSNVGFDSPFTLDPNNPKTMIAGGSSVWRCDDVTAPLIPYGQPGWDTTPVWASIKPSIRQSTQDDNFVSTISIAKSDSNLIWVGYNHGDVYVTTNGKSGSPTWMKVGAGTLPATTCTRIVFDSQNNQRVFASFGGTFTDAVGNLISKNLWMTNDGGTTWTNISGALPPGGIRALAVAGFNSNYIYVGMDVGLFASPDGGKTWSPTNDGPSNVSVFDLFWLKNQLVVATYGRGVFATEVDPYYEVESLIPPQSISSGVTYGKFSDSKMSGGYGVNLNATATGQYIAFNVPVAEPGTYDIKLKCKNQSNKGIFQLAVNGASVGTTQDEYSSTLAYVERDLGTVTFTTAGTQIFKFTVIGKNPSSTSYGVDFDAIVLVGVTHFEAEELSVQAKSAPYLLFADAKMSGGEGTQLSSTTVGQYVTYTVSIPETGTYHLRVGTKTGPKRGTFQLAIDGVNVGSVQDEYSSSAGYKTLDLGLVTFNTAGDNAFKFALAGQNASSTGSSLDFDYIEFVP